MRVRVGSYTKKSPFSYNGVVQATKIQKEKGDFLYGKSIQQFIAHKMDVQISYRIHSKV